MYMILHKHLLGIRLEPILTRGELAFHLNIISLGNCQQIVPLVDRNLVLISLLIHECNIEPIHVNTFLISMSRILTPYQEVGAPNVHGKLQM